MAGAEAVVAATSRGLPLLRGIPRVLGRRYYSPETDWLKHGFAGEVVPSPHGDTWLRLHGVEPDQHQEVAPEQLVGALLREIMAAAERAIGRRPTTVVIAVPNAFDQLQRRALVAAARLAEVPLHSLVQSSAAFALAMPPSQGVARAAVVDFGGGYLDVALVEQQHAGRGWEVTAADGDGLLGGLDFDRRVVGLLPPDGQETPLPVLMDRAAQLRHALTQSDRAMWGGERSAAAVSRAQHDEVVADELAAIGPTCGQVFADVELGTDDVEELVLTGGLAAVPAVQRTVAELFRQMPVRLDGAQDFPALGALRAAQGRRASQRSTRTIGVKVRGGMMSPIIARGRALPWEAAINFGAPAPGQQRIVFEVYEGDAMEAAQNLYLGSFVLEGVAPGHSPRVTFSLDKNGTFRAGNWTTGFTNGQAVFHWAGGFPSDRGLEIAAVDDDYARVPQSASSAVQESEDPTTLLVRRAPRSEHSHIRPSTRPPPPSDQPSPLPSEDPVLGTVVGGRYQIDELIAEGGMGRVYRATHTTLGRRFAVKILHP
ncbi:MAG: Hsp70 family protein, partial [Myxococcales bacterium]|nr:Hsp70 family protein [Myxococcales bacterium]